MKIVISAYDCSPDHGSEAGLGWNWVMAASRYAEFDKVHVITTDRYEKNIKKYMAEHDNEMKRIQFHFLPLPLSRLKKLNQRFKYVIWQWKAGKLAKELCKKEDIHLELNDGYLNVSASHNTSKDEKDDKGNVIRQERYSGTFSRSFYVGENVKEEDIKASYENGELKITFPKEQEKLPEKKTIMIE